MFVFYADDARIAAGARRKMKVPITVKKTVTVSGGVGSVSISASGFLSRVNIVAPGLVYNVYATDKYSNDFWKQLAVNGTDGWDINDKAFQDTLTIRFDGATDGSYDVYITYFYDMVVG